MPLAKLAMFKLNYWIDKFDWLVYKLSYKSINRMCKRKPGFAYLFYLYFQKWIEENSIDNSIKKTAQDFFDSLESYKNQS